MLISLLCQPNRLAGHGHSLIKVVWTRHRTFSHLGRSLTPIGQPLMVAPCCLTRRRINVRLLSLSSVHALTYHVVGYTYPPVEGVQVDKPGATPDQLKKYRSDLQKHFGLNPSSIKGAKGMPIFEQQPISIPNGKKAIEKYRHFIIAVALVEHALNASYTLEIDYKLGEEVKYGHVAVLTRSESSSCAGCAGRRAAGNIVHGIIHLPATHVVEIVAHRSGNDDEINHLKKHLTARLVTAAGIVYASTEDGLDTKNALDESITPELVLHSAFACLDDDKDSLGGPVDFFNWQDHGEMFSGKWKKM